MADASQNKSLVVNSFEPGWILKRGTQASPNGLLVIENARVEPDNSIISRDGAARINAQQLTDGSSTNVHSHTLSGTTRYVGVGTIIQRGIDPGTTIVPGLSGERITFAKASPSPATTEQWTYFCNGDAACRKKDNGTLTRTWGLDGPSAAPTIALSANLPPATLIDAMSTAYTVVDTGTEGVAAEPYEGTARTFTVTTGNTCRFRRTIATLDLSAFGEQGFIRLMVRLSRVADMELLGLAFDVNDGTFTKDFYEVSTSQLGFTVDNTWQELFIRKGDFVRVKSTAGSTLTWSTVKAIQFVVSGTGSTPNPFLFSVDDLRLESDSHLTGVMDYRMTWWNDDLKIRSNARALADIYSLTDRTSGTLNVNHQAITVTKTATTTDPQVTHWELWRRNRRGAGLFQYVDRIPVATPTYLDTFKDEDLGEGLVEDNHIPPPAKFVLEFDDCLFLFGLAPDATLGTGEEQAPYAVRVSSRFRPESFPLTNYFLAGNPTDTIRGGCVWQNQLWIFTKSHVYRVEKLANGYLAQLTEAPVGTESPYSISPSPYGIFYYAPFHGPQVFNGSTSTSISSKTIQPFFEREAIFTDGVLIHVAVPDDVTDHTNVLGQYFNNTYVMVIGATDNTRHIIVYNIEFQRWHKVSGPDLVLQRLDSARGAVPGILVSNLESGTAQGWLLRIAPVTGTFIDPDETPITMTIQLVMNGLLKPEDSEMDLKDFIIDCHTGGQPMLIQASFDDSPLETLGTQSTSVRDRVIVRVPNTGPTAGGGRICYKVALRLTITQTTSRIQLYGIGVNYWLEPRAASTYAGLWTAPREQGWARRGRIVLRSTAPVQMRLVFDETREYTTTLPNTGNQRLGANPTVPTGLHGKVAEVLFSSTAPFVIYPESYIECGVFGGPAEMIPWRFALWESRG